MQGMTALSEALGKYLDLASDQMKLTASNIANLDTPGYKTQGLDFAQEFSRAIQGDDSTEMLPHAVATEGLISRPDGNNVSLDREGMQLAKSQLEFRAGIALLRTDNSRMMSAIHMDSK